MESKELAIALARALDAKKARNIRVIRVHDLTTVTDYFRHCHRHIHHPRGGSGR